jgi:GNAT superfamily N-acetyltransferase
MFRTKLITNTSTYLKKYFLQSRAAEKSRPAIDEVDCFLACDSTLFVGELDSKPIGTCAVFKYQDGYRHGAAYFIEHNYRKYGYGTQLLIETIRKSEPITNFSVYASLHMVETYKKSLGIQILHGCETHDINSITALKNLQGISMDTSYHVKQVSDVDFETLCNYDMFTFGYNRQQFLYKWLYSPASHSCVALNNQGFIVGYVVVRESVVPNEGYKIGPLFCENINIAQVLLQSVFKQINEQGTSTSNSVHISCPVDRDPQVRQLLKILDSSHVQTFPFMANNDNLKGRIDKWFAMTSFETG